MPGLLELQAETVAGARLIACAEALVDRLASRATEHDTDGTYAFENIELLKEADYFTALIPTEFGGQGVDSLHDILVASSRLARADPSTVLGLNMHLLVVMNLARRWRIAQHRGDARHASAFGRSLERIVQDQLVMATAVSEPNQHLTEPVASARSNGTGWWLNGRKIFCTMSPAATTLLVSASYEDPSGNRLYGYAEVPAETPGVVIHDDWDALGMRASGSNSVSFEDVHLPASALRGGFPIGSATGYIERNLANGLFHASASVGIAETAHTVALDRLAQRADRELGAAEQMLVAENAIALSALRATFARAGSLVDAFHRAHLDVDAPPDDWQTVFAETQAAKTFVGETAGRIVDRALTLSGGAGYMRSHVLSRAYRDVRAIGFMQPLGMVRAYDYLAQASLGHTPSLR
jgi:alkylation response protein AidB-like acyl-CoA dehydrogenase